MTTVSLRPSLPSKSQQQTSGKKNPNTFCADDGVAFTEISFNSLELDDSGNNNNNKEDIVMPPPPPPCDAVTPQQELSPSRMRSHSIKINREEILRQIPPRIMASRFSATSLAAAAVEVYEAEDEDAARSVAVESSLSEDDDYELDRDDAVENIPPGAFDFFDDYCAPQT